MDPQGAIRANRELWDEWTRIHETSTFYDLEGLWGDPAGERAV